MRVPITVQISPFDIDGIQSEIDQINTAFSEYLDEVPRKSSSSKHGLMGPIGKILSEVKSGRRDPASLKGYAIRVHEASGRGPSQAALEAMERGVDKLTYLLAEAPLTAHDKILDRLDYGLYFILRKKTLEQREKLNSQLRQFLHEKYKTPEEMSNAWKEPIYIFGPKSKTWSEASQNKRNDMAAFWDWLRSQGATSVEVLLEEEEEL